MLTARLEEIIRQKDLPLRGAVEQLAHGQVREAVEALQSQGRVREISDSVRRLDAIAAAYVERAEGTLVISPDNASHTILNAEIRGKLQERGRVAKEEKRVRVLVPRDLTGADRAWAARYQAGDVVRYSRGSKAIGVQAGELGRIAAVDREKNLLIVERETGEQVTYDPRRLQGVTAYKEVERRFSAGDRVQFTAPDRERQVANRELGSITGLAGGRMSITLDSGRAVELPLEELHHDVDHGYAVTSHSSQGLTCDRVLLNVDVDRGEQLVKCQIGIRGTVEGPSGRAGLYQRSRQTEPGA